MTNKHTPAPWIVEKTMIGTMIVAHGHDIAEITGISDTHYANAKLISAAPELLESLIDCVALLDGLVFSEFKCIEKAREIIKKANV